MLNILLRFYLHISNIYYATSSFNSNCMFSKMPNSYLLSPPASFQSIFETDWFVCGRPGLCRRCLASKAKCKFGERLVECIWNLIHFKGRIGRRGWAMVLFDGGFHRFSTIALSLTVRPQFAIECVGRSNQQGWVTLGQNLGRKRLTLDRLMICKRNWLCSHNVEVSARQQCMYEGP